MLIFVAVVLSCEHNVSLQSASVFPNQAATITYKSYKTLAAKIDSLFQQEYEDGSFIGAGVSVAIGDQIAYENSFGYRDYQQKSHVNLHSVFRIGSLSKSFTGVLSGILMQEGVLSYDDNIQTELPEFALANDTFSEEVTLRHLLSHTTGLPYHSYTNLVEAKLTMKKIIPMFSSVAGIVQPGTVYSYQNAAFAVAGEFIASRKKAPLPVIFKEKMFDPLGMNSTTTDFASIHQSTNKVLPHSQNTDGWKVKALNKKYYNAIPAGGINTTIKDMGKFLLALLGNSPSILSQATIDDITSPQVNTNVTNRYYTKWPNFQHSHYGIGWRIHSFVDSVSGVADTLIHHGGFANGYRSEIAFSRKEKFAVSVMFNSTTTFARTVIPSIVAIIRKTGELKNRR